MEPEESETTVTGKIIEDGSLELLVIIKHAIFETKTRIEITHEQLWDYFDQSVITLTKANKDEV